MNDPPILYMDAEIRPHRSLSKRGQRVVLGILLTYNLIVALFMLAIGAFPAPIFLGLDVLGVVIAFEVSNRRAMRFDLVQVTHDEVRVTRGRGAVSQRLWTSPTAFTKVEVDKTDGRVSQVRLRLSGRYLAVGATLGPWELAEFAASLQAAIRSALAERHA
jgi:uncharacterized membrane protein